MSKPYRLLTPLEAVNLHAHQPPVLATGDLEVGRVEHDLVIDGWRFTRLYPVSQDVADVFTCRYANAERVK